MKDEERERIHQVIRSVRGLNKALYRLLREEAEIMDSTVMQLLVLRYLDKHPQIGLHELARALQLSNSTMSGVVDRMVSAGEIARERSSQDRRLLVMHLTVEGKEKKEAAFNEDSLVMKRLSGLLDLSEEELQQLFVINEKIEHIFEGVDEA